MPAGLGTQVIQKLQRQLMASAWLQVDGIREANQKLRFAQFAREAAERIFARHINVPDDHVVMDLTGPLHTKVRASPITIAARLQASPAAPRTACPSVPTHHAAGRPTRAPCAAIHGQSTRCIDCGA